MIYPPIPETFWGFQHALAFIRKHAAFPPLGLLTVASLLPDEWEKRLIDMNIASLTQSDLEWADFVFVSAMVVQRDAVRDVFRRCKQARLPIIAGGPLFMYEHHSFPEADHFVLGEAEVALPAFVDDVQRDRLKRVYTANGLADMTQSPVPAWELVDLRQYWAMAVQYSRGCPYDCDFCDVTRMLGHTVRTKTVDQVIGELDRLYGLGWRAGVLFADDNFIGSKRKLKSEMLPALIDWRRGKKGIVLWTQACINLADDPELLDLMVRAGFEQVFVGIETPDERGLEECNKPQNKGRDMLESVKVMQRVGIHVSGGFIVGFDSDTPSIFQRQVDFIQQSGVATAMVGLLQAPLGTRLYERLEKEGRLLGLPSGSNTDATMNFRTRMDPKVLCNGYRYILRHIYSPRPYYERVRTFLERYNKPRGRHLPITSNDLLAFLRSVVLLGLLGKERWEYWKLFFWALLHRPRLLPDAISFAVRGFHLRCISERYARRS